MKQTAVQWLASNLGKHIVWEEKIIDLVEQAKQMEKEQIENAYWDGGQDIPINAKQCESYYNETYKSE